MAVAAAWLFNFLELWLSWIFHRMAFRLNFDYFSHYCDLLSTRRRLTSKTEVVLLEVHVFVWLTCQCDHRNHTEHYWSKSKNLFLFVWLQRLRLVAVKSSKMAQTHTHTQFSICFKLGHFGWTCIGKVDIRIGEMLMLTAPHAQSRMRYAQVDIYIIGLNEISLFSLCIFITYSRCIT